MRFTFVFALLLLVAVTTAKKITSVPEPQLSEAGKKVDCGLESPSKVADCDKPDEAFCGSSCCGVQVNITTDSDAASPAKFVSVIKEAFAGAAKTKLFHHVEGPDSDGFMSAEYTNNKGTYRIDLAIDSEKTGKWSFLITSIAHFDGADNGQNSKLITHVLSYLEPLKEHFVSGVEYGCGMPTQDESGASQDDLLRDYLKTNNITYAEFLKQSSTDMSFESSIEPFDMDHPIFGEMSLEYPSSFEGIPEYEGSLENIKFINYEDSWEGEGSFESFEGTDSSFEGEPLPDYGDLPVEPESHDPNPDEEDKKEL